jgi:hypothetical protein
VALSPAGDRLAVLDEYGESFYEHNLDLTPMQRYNQPRPGRALEYSPDGSRMAAAFNLTQDLYQSHGVVALYKTGRSAPVGRIAFEGDIDHRGLEYSPDGSRLFVVTGDWDGYEMKGPFEVVSATKIATSVRLHASRHLVKYGQRVTLTARVADHSQRKFVSFYAVSVRKDKEQFVGKARISSKGVAKLKGVPQRNYWFVARWSGDDRYTPGKSNMVRVEVAVRIAGRIFGAYAMSGKYHLIHSGADAAFIIQVAPVHDRGRAMFGLSVRRRNHWRYLGNVRSRMTKGGAGVSLQGLPAGSYVITGGFGDADHAWSNTKETYFSITG